MTSEVEGGEGIVEFRPGTTCLGKLDQRNQFVGWSNSLRSCQGIFDQPLCLVESAMFERETSPE